MYLSLVQDKSLCASENVKLKQDKLLTMTLLSDSNRRWTEWPSRLGQSTRSATKRVFKSVPFLTRGRRGFWVDRRPNSCGCFRGLWPRCGTCGASHSGNIQRVVNLYTWVSGWYGCHQWCQYLILEPVVMFIEGENTSGTEGLNMNDLYIHTGCSLIML